MRIRVVIWLLFALFLAACSREDEDQPTIVPTRTQRPAGTATQAPTNTPRPTATATATPEPPKPEVSAVEQEVGDDGEVIISHAQALEPSWLVLYADDQGEPGDVLSYVAIEEGESRDILFEVNPYLVTETLYVRLHVDEGERNTFEFPGADEPISVDGEVVAAAFDVDIQVTMPTITAADQALAETGQVILDTVISKQAGWVAVHADDNGEPGLVLGQTPVYPGENSNVTVNFDWRQATRRLHAVLYEDAGRMGRFEPEEEDERVLVESNEVRTAFTVALPADVFVINQPVATGEVYIDRATVNQPGWIAVYSNYNGFIDRRLGYVPIQAGVNENITIPIDTENVTNMLHIMLHEDTGVEDQFEYPVEDPPVRNESDQLLLFSFQIDAGNYIVTQDQALGEENTVQIPLVVSDMDVWVAVWTDEDGAPGEIIGQTLAPRGVNRELLVTIDPDEATDILHVLLHQDAGTLGTFEYPDGPDGLLQRERSFIQAPFRLLAEE